MTAHPDRLRRATRIAVALAAAAIAARADDVLTRITDLAPGGGHGVLHFEGLAFGGAFFFQGSDGAGGDDLWRWDGTNPPTVVPGGEGIGFVDPIVWSGALHFAGGPSGDSEIWRHDGVSAPAEVLDLDAGGSSSPAWLTIFSGELCFGADTAGFGDEVVCWDGAGEPAIGDVLPGGNSAPHELAWYQGELLFAANGGASLGVELYGWDGANPPALVADLRSGGASSQPEGLTAVGTQIYFSAHVDSATLNRLVRYDGISPPAVVSPTFDVRGGLAAFRGELVVDGVLPPGSAWRLHAFDGAGFRPLVWPGGSFNSGAKAFLLHAGALYFIANGSTSRQIFRTCGDGSVERVTDGAALGGSGYVEGQSELVAFGDRILFSAVNSAFGAELWALEPDEATFCHGFEHGTTAGWSSAVP